MLVFALAMPAMAQRKKVSQFEAEDLTEEDQTERRVRSRNRLPGYSSDEGPVDEPFPWRVVTLSLLALVVATPYAYSSWKRSAEDLKVAQRAFAPKKKITRKPKTAALPPEEPTE